MERDEIEAAIRSAFAGVQLGSGVSLRQAQAIDDRILKITRRDLASLPPEVADDWSRVPDEELLRDCVAHLDAEGLRYYLPALMLWLLDHYDEDRLWTGSDMTAIGTIGSLAPPPQFEASLSRIFDGFTIDQKASIAAYLDALPRLIELDHADATSVARSLDKYWGRFLPHSQ
jgi:uncharacterized protein DUF6714